MAHNVFRQLESEKGIFRNEEALSPEFLPERLPGREAQETDLAIALKPAGEGKRPANCFIYGPSGTGKTSTCKHVIEQLKEYSGRAQCFYANCWQHSTEQALLSLMAHKVGAILPRRGLATDEVFDRVTQHFKAKKTVPILVLDEADKLFFGGEYKILYRLSRAVEETGVPYGIVMVTNDETLLAKADQRIRSSLACKQIEFPQYSPSELKQILSYRAKLALFEESFDDDVIALCAGHGAKAGGDARAALQCLWLSAKNAEGKGRSRISMEDVHKAIGKALSSQEIKQERDIEILDEKLKKMLEIITAQKSGMEIGKLYELYEGKYGGSERTLRNYLHELEEKKFVKITPVREGYRLVEKI